ncbi:hypothetical protein AB0M19_31490 [Streptomyces sp. NPDC051920]|uniref:hypothetical protein n=1 Tax=Streptomyces sp. NPDC051920 TaxID=3155523 RepID=UPI00342B6A70
MTRAAGSEQRRQARAAGSTGRQHWQARAAGGTDTGLLWDVGDPPRPVRTAVVRPQATDRREQQAAPTGASSAAPAPTAAVGQAPLPLRPQPSAKHRCRSARSRSAQARNHPPRD